MRVMRNCKIVIAYMLVFILCVQSGVLGGGVRRVYGEEDEAWEYGETVTYGDWKCVVEGETIAIAGYIGNETSIEIPRSIAGKKVTRIDTVAFNECKSLTAITIPDSVTSIGGGAFCRCVNLADIVIPDSVTSIGGGAFVGCGFTSIKMPKYLTNIQKCMFDSCRSLTSIIIPDNVINIGECAFRDCTNLANIKMSKNVINIGRQAFLECNSLASVTIPDSVVSIGASAFSGCSSLSDITIPDSVTSIRGGAFDETLWLKKKQEENPLVVCNGILIDGSSCSGDVIIPDGVINIGGGAFSFCRNLESIVIPDSVISIGDSAFYYCSSLRSVTMPDGLTNIGESAFNDCSKLTDIIIPYGVTSIEEYTFYNCSSLTSVTISDSVTNIGNYAFSGCNSLAGITVPDSVTNIGVYAFFKTAWLENKQKENPLVICNGILIDGSICNGDVIIPNSVTNIGNQAFSGCENLTSVMIPDSVTNIGNHTFSDCNNLTGITMPDSVTNIGTGAFSGTPWLENKQKGNPLVIYNDILIDGSTCSGDVTIPNGVTSIGDGAFYTNDNLTSITIPDSVTNIGNWAFGACKNLTNVIMSNCVVGIGDHAFYGCTGLMFYNYNGLSSIMIPDSVTNIEDNAFGNGTIFTCLTILVSKGSYAEKYAKENNVDYMYIDNVATNITISPIDKPLKTGESLLLTPTITPNNVSIQKMIWSSEDSSIAKVDRNGVVTAISDGEVTITAKTIDGSNLSADCKIKVGTAPEQDTTVDNTTAQVTTGSEADTSVQASKTQATTSLNKEEKEQLTIPKVAKVTKFKATAKKKGFVVSWKKVAGVNGYELQVSTKKNFKGAKTYNINKNKTKHTLSKLKSKTKYYIRIRAYKNYKDANGKTKKAYGTYVSVNKKTK